MKAAAQVGAEAVVVAGDVKARSLLVEKLPADLRERSVVIDRELDVDSDAMTEAADEAVQEIAELGRRRRLDSFRNQLGTGRAVAGLPETVAALRDAQVDEVLLAGDPAAADSVWATRTAWIGPDLADIGLAADELAERGVRDAATDTLGAAVVRAAAGTDAALSFVPDGEPAPRDGIGALLRYAAPGA